MGEPAEPAEWGDELSAEGRMAAIVYGRNPSAEGFSAIRSREPAAVYQLITSAARAVGGRA